MAWKKLLTTVACFTSCASLYSADVMSDVQLQAAIIAANAGTDTTINFTGPITLTTAFGQPLLYPLNSSPTFAPVAQTITITGNGNSLNGGTSPNNYRGFFVRGGTVNISNLVITDCIANGRVWRRQWRRRRPGGWRWNLCRRWNHCQPNKLHYSRL